MDRHSKRRLLHFVKQSSQVYGIQLTREGLLLRTSHLLILQTEFVVFELVQTLHVSQLSFLRHPSQVQHLLRRTRFFFVGLGDVLPVGFTANGGPDVACELDAVARLRVLGRLIAPAEAWGTCGLCETVLAGTLGAGRLLDGGLIDTGDILTGLACKYGCCGC